MKEKIQKINKIILILLIMLSTLLIGTPLKGSNTQIMCIVFGIYSLIYFIAKIIKKEEIKIDKIDILIIILMSSTTIPLIFRTYVSLNENTHGIIKSLNIICIYIIAKNECKNNSQYKGTIINTIIISIMLLCVIGIDEVNNNYFANLKEYVNYNSIKYDETRICSLFSYPNTMAVVAGLGIFLCIGKTLECQNKKMKILYIIASLIMFISLILTYSRLVYIIFAIISIAFICILYIKYKKIYKKNTIITGIAIFLIIIYIAIGLEIPKTLDVDTEYQKILYSIQPNMNYNFEFEIETNSRIEKNCIIKITEKDKYFDDVQKTEIDVGNYSGKKNIQIHTQESTSVIYLNFYNKEGKNKFYIKSFKLNNEQIILKYKILPTSIVAKISNITLSNKSAWERITFMKDAIKGTKENIIFGQGTNAWRTMQYKVQEYNYTALEVHCYPLQIFLENGIIGFLACLGIQIYIITRLVKEFKKQNSDITKISVCIGSLFVFAHSLFDFDMSFYYVQIIMFLLLATLDNEEEKELPIKHKWIVYILIIISIFIVYIPAVEFNFKKTSEVTIIDGKWTEEKIFETYNKLMPYNKDVKIRLLKIYEKQNDTDKARHIIKNLIATEQGITDNIVLNNIIYYVQQTKDNNDEMEYILEYIKKTENYAKYNALFQIQRLQNFTKIISNINDEDIQNKYMKQLNNELEEKEKYILDYKNSRYDKNDVKEYEQKIEILKR